MMSYDFQSDSREYPPRYVAVSASSPTIEKFDTFDEAIEYCKVQRDSLIKIKIGDREVCGIKNECGKIYVNDVEELTKSELDILSSFPVHYNVTFRAIMEKYRDCLNGNNIEDLEFIRRIRNDERIDGAVIIMQLWDRFWNVRIRARGDTKDGIYLLEERDIFKSEDKNTFNYPPSPP